MTQPIPDLWGPIDVGVIGPVAILRVQAGKLAEHTRGLLEGEVKSAAEGTGVRHTFDVVVPALRRYRVELLSVTQDRREPFPADVWFAWDASAPATGPRPPFAAADPTARSAATAAEFNGLLADALGSPRTLAVIRSLIARSVDPTAA